MNLESFLKVTEAITPIIQSLIWPLILFLFFLWVRKPLGLFFSNLSELKVKAVGVEASAISQRGQIKAAALLGAATRKDTDAEVDTSEIADAVSKFARNSKKLAVARVLWVDDMPRNNYYEREALEQMGIEFGIVKSTEEAINKLEQSDYDLIISDMGRPSDSRAGYTLLDTLRKEGINTPFVIYSSSRSLEHRKEAIEHGAVGCTNRPDELFILVSRALLVASRKNV